MMLSHERHRQHRSFLQTSKSTREMLKQPTLGTLSPETTTSSGYSTGGSSISTSVNQSLKKSSSIQQKSHLHQEQKTKSKGLPNLFNKLKNLLLPSKNKSLSSKPMRSMAISRQISSSNIRRQYGQQSPIYDRLPSSASMITNNTVSLPFTYYHHSPIGQSKANFDKISAWLHHTEKSIKSVEQDNHLAFIDATYQPAVSSTSNDTDDHGITVVMRKNSINIQPPKRSSSLVTRFTRPILEQQIPKTLSTSSSFSSSILMRGMSESMTPPSMRSQRTSNPSSKSSGSGGRRRTAEHLPRKSTGVNVNDEKSMKENHCGRKYEQFADDIYQFPSFSSNNNVDMQIPPSGKSISTKKYYFHSNPTRAKEDLLNNSYGLTLLQHQPRHSTTTNALMISQIPNQISSHKPSVTPRTSTRLPQQQQECTRESLDDLLCDQEVESYFYPTSSQSEHVYMNIKNPSLQATSPIHGTLC